MSIIRLSTLAAGALNKLVKRRCTCAQSFKMKFELGALSCRMAIMAILCVKVNLAVNKQLISDTTLTTSSDQTGRRSSMNANNGPDEK